MNLDRVVDALAANAMSIILAGCNPKASTEYGVSAHELAHAIGYSDSETGCDMPICFAKHGKLREAWQMGNQQYFTDQAIYELVGL